MKGIVIPYSAKLTNLNELNTALDWTTESELINSKSEMGRITSHVVSSRFVGTSHESSKQC